ncbi:transposase (fragment) [Mesorhizobium plurifarium]|uniref:Transposase n=1 Tax=Mesorhizobium plurifarium TaxID=69974 RepID=A0A090FFU0_MESPL
MVSAFIATSPGDRSLPSRSGQKSSSSSSSRNETEHDVLAGMSFVKEHRIEISVEPLNGEIEWSTEVVGIFPNEAIMRLVGAAAA